MSRNQKIFALLSIFIFALGITLYGMVAWKCKEWYVNEDCQDGGCMDASTAEDCRIYDCAPDGQSVKCSLT